MKNKTKLLMTIMSMCLVVTLGVIGILAVKKLDLNIGGSVNFSAEGVALEVSAGKFYTDANHSSEYTGLATGKMQGFSIDTNTPYNNIKTAVESWSGLTLNLDERGDAYLHFTVKNNMTQTLYISLSVSNGTQDANKNIEILTIESVENIAGNLADAKDFVFHFDIKDTDVNASLTDFAIELDFKLIPDAVIDKSTGVVNNISDTKYTNVKYTLSNGKVTAQDVDNAKGDVIIVDKVIVDGIPYPVTAISDYSFRGAEITSIHLPATVVSIGGGIYGCSSLNTITVDENNPKYYVNQNCLIDRDTNIIIRGCNSSVIPLDGSITGISDDAFYGTGIKEVIMPDNITIPSFSYCYKLEKVVLPANATTIPEYAFYYCGSVFKEITFPKHTISIHERAFSLGAAPETIKLPDGATDRIINGYLISGGTIIFASQGATAIPKDETVTSIGRTAFLLGQWGWTNPLTIPENITNLETACFHEPDSPSIGVVGTLIFETETPPSGFDGAVYYGATIYVPTEEAVTTYTNALLGWYFEDEMYAFTIQKNPNA